MSRYCGEKNVEPILNAANTWKNTCLINGESLFGLGNVWNPVAFEELVEFYVENLDYNEGNFNYKLEMQLEPTSRDAKVLCAEIMWIILLAPSNINPKKKRENIASILSWAGLNLPENEAILGDPPLIGIGSGGTAYNNLRWKELIYCILLFKELFALSKEDRVELLKDSQKLANWIEQIDDNESRQFRHMFMYFLFPDCFERIFGKGDRLRILKSFTDLQPKQLKKLSAYELDQELANVREKQESSFGSDKIDWYVPPLKAMWQDTTKSLEATEDSSIFEALLIFLEQAETNNLKTKDYPGAHAGLNMRVSFGAGNQALVPWIGLLGADQTPTKGIYPVFLYYRADRVLILAKGVSATNAPLLKWGTNEDDQTIDQYFQKNQGANAVRYGESYVHAVYDTKIELNKKQVDTDLSELIAEYHTILGTSTPNINEPTPPTYVNEHSTPPSEPVSLDSLMRDVFIERSKIEDILSLISNKKNIVLQGPPGVGKSFIAKRLAYALMGYKDSSRVEMVQFHQSYAYEDFVQGYRPSDSGFELKNGLFHQFCTKASADPEKLYVFIIDEINRGNLSKIFGELMLLIEADKRGKEWQIPLTYSKDLGERFYVPDNVHLIGLMNTADRSLSMVDYALRRRFAFVDLVPEFRSEGFSRHLSDKGADDSMIATIVSRMNTLNDKISKDVSNLGPGFCIGHSFFCSAPDNSPYDKAWFDQVVKFEIAPLVNEYWFDDPSTAQSIIEGLLA